MFYDRQEAGQRLTAAINKQLPTINKEKTLILALPRGGVIVGAEIAKALNLPLDVIIVRKIGHPQNLEYAVAAVGENSFVKSEERTNQDYLKREIENQRKEIQRRIRVYRGERKPLNLKDKTVILVDDGLATGLTMKAAIKEVKKQKPHKIILAVTVAPPETIAQFKKKTNQVVCLKTPSPFYAIGNFYTNFEQVSDEQVKTALKHSNPDI